MAPEKIVLNQTDVNTCEPVNLCQIMRIGLRFSKTESVQVRTSNCKYL